MNWYAEKVEGAKMMTPMSVVVNDLLNSLEEEDYNTVLCFIRFLLDSRRKEQAERSVAALKEIQGMFSEDKGWDSEKAMLEDMAEFRRERNSA